MTTAIDTNIIVSFWDENDALNLLAKSALNSALARGGLVVAAPVYAELLAFPTRSESLLDYFFKDTGVAVDWNMDEPIWRTAGRAFQSHASRRKTRHAPGPRRILADFLIGAHAFRRGYTLLTMDDQIYRTAFPRLTIVRV